MPFRRLSTELITGNRAYCYVRVTSEPAAKGRLWRSADVSAGAMAGEGVDSGREVAGRQVVQQAPVPYDAFRRVPLLRLQPKVGGHQQLELEDHRLERQQQVPLPGESHHLDVEALVGVVLRERVSGSCRLGHPLPRRRRA